MCFAPQRRAFFRHLNFQKWREHLVFCTFWLRHVLRTTTAYTFWTSQLPNAFRRWGVLYILTWKCASRHNVVHFLNIATSKSVLSVVCFVHFDFEMCFAPQRRALFEHRNFQKCSERCVFYTFWLPKYASRHGGVHFFHISTFKSAPKLRCFVHFEFEMCFAPQRRAIFHLSSGQMAPHSPTFRPSGATNHWKNRVFRDFATFSRTCIQLSIIILIKISYDWLILYGKPIIMLIDYPVWLDIYH